MTRRAALLRLVTLALLLAAALVVARVTGIPSVDELQSRVEPWGWRGAASYAALYAVVTLSPLPKTVFSLGAGALFGLGGGVGVVVVGACLGAVLAFYLARALGHEGVHRLTGSRADRLHARLARRGFLTVLVLRLVPVVPFTAVNYLAGLTSLRVRVFLSATALGILPTTTTYVALGAYGSRPGSWPFWTALASVVVLTTGGGIAALRHRRRAVRRLEG